MQKLCQLKHLFLNIFFIAGKYGGERRDQRGGRRVCNASSHGEQLPPSTAAQRSSGPPLLQAGMSGAFISESWKGTILK